jgi:cell division protein FtsW
MWEKIADIKKQYFILKGDKILWIMIFLLMAISLIAVYSSTGKLAYTSMGGNTIWPLIKQVILLGMAVCVMIVIQWIHYKYFIMTASTICWGALLLLVTALLITIFDSGARINSTARWIELPIIGSIQPSEIAKLGLVMYMSRVIAFGQRENDCTDRVLWKIGLFFIPMWILIFKENFSTSVLLALVCWLMLFIGRVRWKTLLILSFVSVTLATAFLVTIYNTDKFDHIGRVSEIKRRLDNTDPFQAEQAKIAIARGGLSGTGPGRSVQRNFLPNPHSDYIYAIIVEEYGLFGGGLVLLIYMIILFRIGVIVWRCTRAFPALLVTGLGFMIVLQAIIHICVCVSIGPVTGQPLPLVSTGGTSIVLFGFALGMIQSVAHTFSSTGKEEEEERSIGEKERTDDPLWSKHVSRVSATSRSYAIEILSTTVGRISTKIQHALFENQTIPFAIARPSSVVGKIFIAIESIPPAVGQFLSAICRFASGCRDALKCRLSPHFFS